MRKYLLTVIGLVLLCLLAAMGTASGSPDTITVDSTTDVLDADSDCDDVDIGDLPGGDTKTSLREAICAANNNTGSDTIAFNIPVSDTGYQVSGITGTWTISLTSGLPILTDDATIISGTTQAVNQGDLNPNGPEIEISGANLSGVFCVAIESADNVVHGLVINRCPLAGVLIQTAGADRNTVSGNYIGTDASGSSDLGNKNGVVMSYGPQGNVVGGDSPEERNVISGNDQYGVAIFGSGTMSNTVSGNYIGTDETGAHDLGNSQTAVPIYGGAKNNTVGGDTAGERNIISGNDGSAVSIREAGTDNNTVSGNFIGTVVSGTQALGNSGNGVYITTGAQNNTVGGDTEGERNVIAANSTGVSIVGSDTMSNTVSGNYIGIDVTGSIDLGNTFDGIQIGTGAHHNVVGGQTAGERNVISGNSWRGVFIELAGTDYNIISGNYIGTDATGAQDLGNSQEGIRIHNGAQDNTIGGQTAAQRNVIAGNSWDGVVIHGAGTTGNTVCGNFIGTDVTGSSDLGNTGAGVQIQFGAQNNAVGGDTEGERNVISSNSKGVGIQSADTMSNTVSGNYIGTDVTGTSDLGNSGAGVYIQSEAQNNTIGGQTAGERNVISGNNSSGVAIAGSGTDGNTVSGNYIGTDAAGTQELANTLDGVKINLGAQNNTIGGQTAGERNIIAANSGSGVYIRDADTDGNTVSHNYIGTDVTGILDRGNGYDGVRIESGPEDNTVGPHNLLAHNDQRGVSVGYSSATGNTITQDSIHSNVGLGIDLWSGGNGGISAPTVSSVDACFGTVSGTAGAGDTVEVFTGPDEEGERYLDSTEADGSGDWEVAGSFTFDTYVTATATDASGNTSEFSTQVEAHCYSIFLPLGVKNY